MAVRQPLISPRHLLILFAGVTLILALALVWLGALLLRRDRSLSAQHQRERLDVAASSVAAALEQRLATAEAALAHALTLPPPQRDDTLSRWGSRLDGEAVLVEFSADLVRTFPPGRMLYYPGTSPPGATPTAFAAGERLEFRDQDLLAAIDAYRLLASSTDRATRAEALLRLGRAQRKQGELALALETYGRLRSLDPQSVAQIPSGLAGAHAALTVLEELKRDAAARRLADSLLTRLETGEWHLTRGAFEFYRGDLRRRAGPSPPGEALATAARRALSRAVDSLWQEWEALPRETSPVRRHIAIDGTPVLAVWAGGSRRIAFVSTARHLESSWIREATAALGTSRFRIALFDANGESVTAPLSAGDALRVTRSAAETRLPWSLAITVSDPASLTSDLAGRRRLLLAGLLIALLMAVVGTYVVVRAVGRELDVARVQSDFVAAVSHEFRTPLTSLRQLTELLASGRVATEERKLGYFEVLRRETERLQRLVEGLLDFGRMEAGTREYRRESLDASSLARDVTDEFRSEVTHAGTPLEVATHEGRCTVHGDREALARALWNLLDNAAKYSPRGTPVEVAVSRRNGVVAISVRDHGLGIPKAEQQAVFDKFVRGSAARASGANGTGLGLAMVRQIVRAHGGAVRVVSAPGQGSTFTIELPAGEDA